jgi:2-dehydro-3-deoxyphosphogalactonate aldolase
MKEPACLNDRFDAACRHLPLVAILRGVRPIEAIPISAALYEAGFRLIEVPLNSPDPFDSIASIRHALPGDALVGAGTVLEPGQLARLAQCHADLAVMPHADAALIRAAKAAGLICMPGVATPTEAFAALQAGADALKLFPAEMISPSVLKAMRAVLPGKLRLFPVGGISPATMAPYLQAGASGFGLGSALYRPGAGVAEVSDGAHAFVAAWRSWHSARPG